ncbi:hypothetical protein [Anaeromicropila herbilytica]|uniref:Uncharacterized protein n=1 Tax=Anaeromicropila herbilytica TaxID=2785025 RepID=A0A7R7EI35_9FIRM|nr:hypothetical protein [Anaeromicropila herbilytica]BCN28847.1 hypothetical protein bsdtb5_01420 [Anaeromicropila herbilytica]
MESQESKNIDKRDVLKGNVFSYKLCKNKKIIVYWHQKEVKMLNAKEGIKFLEKISIADDFEKQLIMAKITGNFKHGNEKK